MRMSAPKIGKEDRDSSGNSQRQEREGFNRIPPPACIAYGPTEVSTPRSTEGIIRLGNKDECC
jgi:hypothetical protein